MLNLHNHHLYQNTTEPPKAHPNKPFYFLVPFFYPLEALKPAITINLIIPAE
ncbi:hypothetical protein HanRHA438_Chr04g0197631 [Helianthus annuus]|nr:hypothetical protein HanPI659440_Chr05g0189001 [Helianthus annuus]KAJ0928762.1 hypothetical protein HanRHA438_Chr04g0197631 [Helianthus annuus]